MINLDQTIVQKALKIALEHGHQFSEIFAEKTEATSISLEDNKIDKVRSGIDSGTGFRIINGEKTHYGFVNSLAETDILNLAKTISQGAALNPRKKAKPLELKPLSPIYLPIWRYLPSQVELARKVAYLQAADTAARRQDKRIAQVAVRYSDSIQSVLIANSNGIYARDKRVRVRFFVEAIAKQKKATQTGYEAIGTTKGLEIFAENNPEKIARTAATRAILNLEAGPAPAGPMTVILAGSAGGTMIHEACGHALEADFIYKKTSVFTGTPGRQLVSPLITVIDDGTIPGNYGSASFDDEGAFSHKNILIEKGIVRQFMNDYLYSTLLGHKPTGNGRRESYRFTPIPRMTNTYIQAGNIGYQDILGSVKTGLLVKKMGGGQVDTTNGNFVFEITEGYLLKNGKVDRPVRGATLVGNGVEVLRSVDMVGNDLHFIPGTCGKGQAAPVSDGQPTLRIPELIIGGQQ